MSAKRTLIASFLHFDLSFTLWALLGALGAIVAQDLGLGPAQKGWMVAVPILTGSLARIPMGLLADRHGGRRVGLAMLLVLYVPLLLGLVAGRSLPSVIAIGALLGVAGASFAVALPLASRWYPPEKQGLVMGLAAAGNSGTVVANLVAPVLARRFGWHAAFGLATIPLTVVIVAFAMLAEESPSRRPPERRAAYGSVLRENDLWWLCLFYGVTFGGYVGLGGFLPVFLVDQYGLDAIEAGRVTAVAACAGSFARPIGGWLSDRVGAIRMLSCSFPVIALGYALTGALPSRIGAEVLLVGIMIALGSGNGAVFQIVPLRFRERLGIATGIIGALGGVGGFFLPTLLGTVKQASGSFATAFAILAAVAAAAFVSLRVLVAARSGWRFGFRGLAEPEGAEVAS